MSELKDDCLFCKIIKGEIPSYTVFENDDVKAFLDISQVTKGHTLLIPKKHLTNIFDYTQADGARFLQYIPVVAEAIKKSDPAIKGLNVEINNGEIAGQVVMHSHIHLIPRYTKEEVNIPHNDHSKEYDDARYSEVASAIKNNF